jgi:hypothetical protein
VLETLINMMESKSFTFQREGAAKALTLLPSLPEEFTSKLLQKMKTRSTVQIIKYAEVLCSHGYRSSLREIVLNYINPENWTVDNWIQGFVDQAVEIIKMLKIMEDEQQAKVVVDHLLGLLKKIKEDHWAEMEVITGNETVSFLTIFKAISNLGYRDKKLIRGLELCLLEDRWGANSNGVRDAIVRYL